MYGRLCCSYCASSWRWCGVWWIWFSESLMRVRVAARQRLPLRTAHIIRITLIWVTWVLWWWRRYAPLQDCQLCHSRYSFSFHTRLSTQPCCFLLWWWWPWQYLALSKAPLPLVCYWLPCVQLKSCSSTLPADEFHSRRNYFVRHLDWLLNTLPSYLLTCAC